VRTAKQLPTLTMVTSVYRGRLSSDRSGSHVSRTPIVRKRLKEACTPASRAAASSLLRWAAWPNRLRGPDSLLNWHFNGLSRPETLLPRRAS
jgi:hypothetical protein